MAGGLEDLQPVRAEDHDVALLEMPVGRKSAGLLGRVNQYPTPGPALEVGVAAGVVPMAVGVDDTVQLQPQAFEPGRDFRRVAPGVDNHGLGRGFVAQNKAVDHQRAGRQVFQNHGPFKSVPG